jgi:anti-sigma regulatory factor (Ser/Thr protein kinase)
VTPAYHAVFTGDPKNVPLARNAIASFAYLCGFSQDEVADIRLAAGEALSNAVEHGRAHRSNGFSVRCSFKDNAITIEIRDNGSGFAIEERRELTPEASDRGFGIFLMRRLMDNVLFERNGTAVRLVRHHAG